MWDKIADFIIKKRTYFILAILVFTGIMGYFATKVEIDYQAQTIVPKNDPDFQGYLQFQKSFGDDNNKIVLGFTSLKVFNLAEFGHLFRFCEDLSKLQGVKQVLSPTHLLALKLDTGEKFVLKPFIANFPRTQIDLDSLKIAFLNMRFYQGLLYNESTGSALVLLIVDKKTIDSKSRIRLMEDIKTRADGFEKEIHAEMHISGLPYVKTDIATTVRKEIILFTVIAFLLTALLLFLFFRSFKTLIIAIIFIAVGVITMFGLAALLEYKLTLISGTLPPLLVVVGVQNCIYLINKYHEEFRRLKDKNTALVRVISNVGIANFLINFTTAVGFGTFYFTKIQVLEQFGLLAFITINIIFIINIIGMPVLYSFISAPSDKQVNHLNNRNVGFFLDWIKFMVFNRRRRIYFFFLAITLLSAVFILRLRPLAFVVDDIPHNSKIYKDLGYFQDNFHGVLPYEIVIKAVDEGDIMNPVILEKVNRLQKALKRFPELSKPMSLIEVLSYANQVVNDNNPDFYRLPNAINLADIAARMPEEKIKKSSNFMHGLIDSSHSKLRVSYQIKDVGSDKFGIINQQIQGILEHHFPSQEYSTEITGTSPIFLKGVSYLLGSLRSATFWSLIIISLTMGFLFPSFRMVIIAIVPNIIPLLVTAGAMGYFDIPLKPSTILIFSIAFGITVDATIHFIICFRRELVKMNRSVREAIDHTIMEVGLSMLYSMVAICAGFLIFIFSDFQGTQAMGYLTGLTLFMGMTANLLLLPCFILSFEKYLNSKDELSEQVFEIPD
ncbi:MAG: hypothetical protein CK532_01490 [Flavobacteriales bacterium]|nr:MAG: hypothetical protein CK532_01490 [Flavobacteriales bacterium]